MVKFLLLLPVGGLIAAFFRTVIASRRTARSHRPCWSCLQRPRFSVAWGSLWHHAGGLVRVGSRLFPPLDGARMAVLLTSIVMLLTIGHVVRSYAIAAHGYIALAAHHLDAHGGTIDLEVEDGIAASSKHCWGP